MVRVPPRGLKQSRISLPSMKSKVNLMGARRQGFTLVELLVVITIIVVLVALSLLGTRTFLNKAAAV